MKMPNVFIKMFSSNGGWDGESAAYVFLGFKSWERMSGVLNKWDPDGALYPTTRSSSDRFRRWDMVAAGCLQHDPWSDPSKHIYYPCSTRVRTQLKNKGYGALLYKALIMATIKHAKRKRKPCVFSSHAAVGGMTSHAAMRVYPSLARKGYLIPAEESGFYTLGKIPKNFKPIFY